MYVMWRDGAKRSIPAWIIAVVLGPVLYLAIAPAMFGSLFRYFTYDVPKQWAEITWGGIILRLTEFIVVSYLALAMAAAIAVIAAFLRSRRKISVWLFMFPVVLLSGLFVELDPGNNNNVFIPMGVWFIVAGMIGLKQLTDRCASFERRGLLMLALSVSFALFVYNPVSVIVPTRATTDYQDFVNELRAFDGSVYAPFIGQLEDEYEFSPAVHWVPMVDLMRGPHIDLRNHPLAHELLAPLMNPTGNAYIIMPVPLETDEVLAFLSDRYALETDWANGTLHSSRCPSGSQ